MVIAREDGSTVRLSKHVQSRRAGGSRAKQQRRHLFDPKAREWSCTVPSSVSTRTSPRPGRGEPVGIKSQGRTAFVAIACFPRASPLWPTLPFEARVVSVSHSL